MLRPTTLLGYLIRKNTHLGKAETGLNARASPLYFSGIDWVKPSLFFITVFDIGMTDMLKSDRVNPAFIFY